MSNQGGMFDGDGDLAPDYSYGTFDEDPEADTPDFQRAFPVVANKILFITGDRTVWGIADYADLRALIDDKKSVSLSDLNDPDHPMFAPNLAFEVGIDGVVSNTYGNVLSRANAPWLNSPLPPAEEPWISISGTHHEAVDNGLIVWGEADFPGPYEALKNSHEGINVFVAFLEATDKAQCKNGGWQDVSRSDGSAFKNQGDCVSYVASQGRSDGRGNRGN